MTNWKELLGVTLQQEDDIRFVGYSYIKQGKYDIALTFFETLAKIAPDNAYDVRTLGALYLQKGDNHKALQELERALTIDPTHEPTKLNRVKALFALGYAKQGLEQAELLIKSPNQTVAKHAAALVQTHK